MNTKQVQYQQARNLYFQTELTQVEIARIANISDKTLYRWINEDQWKNIKASACHTPAMLVEQFYTQLSALNLAISEREERPYPTKEEADLIRKLTLSIKTTKQGQTQSDNIQMMMHFIDQLQTEDPDLAQQVTRHADTFIAGKMHKGFNPWQIEYRSRREQLYEEQIEKEEITVEEEIGTSPIQSQTGHESVIDIPPAQSLPPLQTTEYQSTTQPIPTAQNVYNKKTHLSDITDEQMKRISVNELIDTISNGWLEYASQQRRR